MKLSTTSFLLFLIFCFSSIKCKKASNTLETLQPGISVLQIEGSNGFPLTDDDVTQIVKRDGGLNTRYVRIVNVKGVKKIDLSSLQKLIEVIVTNNNDLTDLLLPNVTEITNTFTLTSNLALNNLNLNKISLIGKLIISGSPQLRNVEMPSLTNSGKLLLISSSAFFKLSFPKLKNNLDSLTISGAYSGIDFPSLESVGGFFAVTNSCDPSNRTTFSMPSLNYCKILFLSNNYFNNYSFPLLAKSDGVWTNNLNTNIPVLAFPALKSLGFLNIANRYSSTIGKIDLPLVDSIPNGLNIQEMNNNFELNIPVLKYSGSISLQNDTLVSTINFPLLKYVNGDITINQLNNSLTNVNFPLLDSISGNIKITSSSSTNNTVSLNLQEIKKIGSNLEIGLKTNLQLNKLFFVKGDLTLSKLTQLNLPILDSVGSTMSINGLSSISPLNIDNLRGIGFSLSVENSSITSLSFLSLRTIATANLNQTATGHIRVINNSRLTNINWPLLNIIGSTSNGGCNFSFPSSFMYLGFVNNNFNSGGVNSLLNKLAGLPNTLKCRNIEITQQPPFTPAPPLVQGIVDKNFLISKGNIVTTD